FSTRSEKYAIFCFRRGRESSDAFTLRSSIAFLFQKRITTTLCASSARLTGAGSPGVAGALLGGVAGLALLGLVVGAFAAGVFAAGGVCDGAGVEELVVLGLCVAMSTPP